MKPVATETNPVLSGREYALRILKGQLTDMSRSIMFMKGAIDTDTRKLGYDKENCARMIEAHKNLSTEVERLSNETKDDNHGN